LVALEKKREIDMRIISVVLTVLVLGMNHGALASHKGSSLTKQEAIHKMETLYQWLNFISNPKNPYTPKDVEKYFTPHFQMIMNGKLKTKDYKTLADHFEHFRKSKYILSGGLPFEEILFVPEEKKIIVKYSLQKNYQDGAKQDSKVIAIFTIEDDGRVSCMNEVVYSSEKY
jgi:hypothetical protein